MEFKGTKGEWKFVKYEYNFEIENFSQNWLIARTITNYEQDEANAKLISKAPEILELLSQFVNISDELNVPPHLFETFANLYANAFNTIKEATTI